MKRAETLVADLQALIAQAEQHGLDSQQLIDQLKELVERSQPEDSAEDMPPA